MALVQVRQGDLGGRDLVIVADVGRGVSATVLELDFEPHAELLDVEARGPPVDPDSLADSARLVR